MSKDLLPCLDVLRSQIATALVPRDDNARKVPLYGHRLLTALLAEARLLPALRREALAAIDALLDELLAALAGTDDALVLTPRLLAHVRSQPDFVAAEPCLQSALRLLVARPDTRSRELTRRVIAILAEVHESMHRHALENEPRPAAVARGLDMDQVRRLRDHLRGAFPDDAALEVDTITTIIGGGSKLTLRVALRHTRTLPSTVVMRVDMSGSIVGSSVANEYQLIRLAHEAGLPVPRPYLLEQDTEVIGAPFIVVSCVEGRNIGDWLEVTEPSRAFAVDLAHALAKLHAIPPERAGALPGADMPITARVARDIAYYEACWRGAGESSVELELACDWLKRHVHLADGRRAIIHRDVGCHNMLALEGRLSGLLDWETAAIGNPAFDLMYARIGVEQMMPWEEFLAEYARAGGIPPTPAETDFYTLLTQVYGNHFTYLSRVFIATGLTQGVTVAYAAHLIHLHYQRSVNAALQTVLARY